MDNQSSFWSSIGPIITVQPKLYQSLTRAGGKVLVFLQTSSSSTLGMSMLVNEMRTASKVSSPCDATCWVWRVTVFTFPLLCTVPLQQNHPSTLPQDPPFINQLFRALHSCQRKFKSLPILFKLLYRKGTISLRSHCQEGSMFQSLYHLVYLEPWLR